MWLKAHFALLIYFSYCNEFVHPRSNREFLRTVGLRYANAHSAFQIELEFGGVSFYGEGKTGVPGEKPLGAKERTNNKLNPHTGRRRQDSTRKDHKVKFFS